MRIVRNVCSAAATPRSFDSSSIEFEGCGMKSFNSMVASFRNVLLRLAGKRQSELASNARGLGTVRADLIYSGFSDEGEAWVCFRLASPTNTQTAQNPPLHSRCRLEGAGDFSCSWDWA